MEDRGIIELYWQRSESAIAKTAEQYGQYCHRIAYNILGNLQDSEECVNDTYLRAWNAIPPKKPNNLAAFLGRITRNLALDKLQYNTREKRGGGQRPLALEELEGCIPAADGVEKAASDRELAELINGFLERLPARKRQVFVRRYWYFSSTKEIARAYGISESNVKVTLFRIRKELKAYLEKEGVTV